MSEPSTWSIGPGVPVALPPFNTSPSTSKETCPVARLTRALPPVVLQGVLPGLMPPTASLAETVILPTIVLHRTIESSLSQANVPEAYSARGSNTANTFFIFILSFDLKYPFDSYADWVRTQTMRVRKLGRD